MTLDNRENLKILLINADGEYKEMESNRGAEAVLISTMKILKNFFSNAKYITTIQLSDRLSNELKWEVIKNNTFSYRTYSVFTSLKSTLDLFRCFLWSVLYRFTGFELNALVNNRKLKAYREADLIIHLGMDLYSDDFGLLTVFEHSKDILQGVFLGKKVMIWAESVGPFRNRFSRILAKYTLNKVSLITIREKLSKGYLDELPIADVPIYVTMDPAFLLDPSTGEKLKNTLNKYKLVNDSRPLIGVSLSLTYLAGGVKKPLKIKFINNVAKTLQYILPEFIFTKMLNQGKKSSTYSNARIEYTKLISCIIDELIEETGAKICLIPHLQHPLIGELPIHEMVYNQSKNKENIVLVSDYCDAQDIKGIIGQCDLFIGGRMHACIAALSQGVPTVGLSYSYKFQGIAAMVNLDKYICNDISYECLRDKIRDVWNSRESIEIELKDNQLKVSQKAFDNGKLAEELLRC